MNKILRKATHILIVEDDPLAAGAVELALSMVEENIKSTIIRSSFEAADILEKNDADSTNCFRPRLGISWSRIGYAVHSQDNSHNRSLRARDGRCRRISGDESWRYELLFKAT